MYVFGLIIIVFSKLHDAIQGNNMIKFRISKDISGYIVQKHIQHSRMHKSLNLFID